MLINIGRKPSSVFGIMSFMNKKALIFSRATGYGAPQRRIDNLVTMLNECGYVCYVVSFSNNPYKQTVKVNEGLFLVSLGPIKTSFFKKMRGLFFGPCFARFAFRTVCPDLAIIYSTIWSKTARFIKGFCKKRSISLIFDVVESRYKPTRLTPKGYLSYDSQNWMINNRIIGAGDKVFCISHYLESFFRERGAKTFYYPITFNPSLEIERKNGGTKTRFLYAGVPDNGRDLIADMVSAFAMLGKNEIDQIEFYVCGPSMDVLKKEGVKQSDIERLGSSLLIMGKLPVEELYTLMEKIDFTVLLKDPNKRFSIAGFPTKMAESFSKKIPMVCNLTGDMAFFAKDMLNAVVCETFDSADFSKALRRAIEIKKSPRIYDRISQAAFDTVLQELNTAKYAALLKDFLCK